MAKSLAGSVDPRFLREEGTEVFTGNELIVKGLLETEGGTHLWTGYPGSPVAGFFDCIEAIREIPKKQGIRAVIANNEALAAAMLNGSQMHGLRAIAVMKSVGVHVASDAIAIGNLAGAHPEGGAVIVLGDDPWSDSTQVPSDSRFLCKHLHMPVLEPSSNQELKDWVDHAFTLSRESELYIGYLVTTNQADGGGTVTLRRNHPPRVNTLHPVALDTARVDFEKMVLLPPRTWRREQNLPERYARLWRTAERLGIDRLRVPARSGAGRFPLAFVVSGLAASYLDHALGELDLLDKVPVLKLGITYPVNPAHLTELFGIAENVVVVEERRGFIEEQVTLLAHHSETPVHVWGKTFPGGLTGLPADRGLNPSVLLGHLVPLVRHFATRGLAADLARCEREQALIDLTERPEFSLAARIPAFCPGCPHRDSASVLGDIKRRFSDGEYMRRKHRRDAVDLVFHGDTGCYTMLMFEPNKDLMHNYSGMGLGGGTGLGIDAFITNKQVVFMGDSTFFHSGQIAISNSVKNGQDITYIILDNKITAMTGHQITPGLDTDLLGNPTHVQSIDQIIGALGSEAGVEVIRTNPAARETYAELLEQTILKQGVKVIVADKECGITFHRRLARDERAQVRKQGFVSEKRVINVTADACENCLECTMATGCPGLTFVDTDHGPKIQTDLTWCVADTACTKIYACPSFEEVTIVRGTRPSSRLAGLSLENLPMPRRREFPGAWRAYLAGVGGMGIAVSTATLVRAGKREGYEVVFCDKNGLAIRNGGVYSHLTYLQPGAPPSASVIPYGKADLLIGLDALECARGIDPAGTQRVASPFHTAAILNTVKTPTIHSLLGQQDFCVSDIEAIVRANTRSDRYFSTNVSEAAEHYFGTKIYANIMMLGVAFQRGELPLSLESLEWAIRETMGSAAPDNWTAFNLGRYLVEHPATLAKPAPPSWQETLATKAALLRAAGRGAVAADLERLVPPAAEALQLDAESLRLFTLRMYELIQYDGTAYARRYADTVLSVFRRDTPGRGYAATRAVLWNAARVMLIKDEIWVAHLLTSAEKHERDYERYNIDPDRGDRLVYRHLNRPEFSVAGRTLRFHIRSQDWMLRLMAGARFLRRVLPGWHSRERAFRDWYLQLTDRFHPESASGYDAWVETLRLPEQATGYREVRYPKMDAARNRAEQLLSGRTPPAAHEPATRAA
jgi:indolepyruvate ferredoxin oxidoreductase